MDDPENHWETIDSKVVVQTPWLTVIQDNVINPAGRPSTYTYTVNKPFVLVLVWDGARFVLVRQYRYPIKRVTTEFPAGALEEGEEPLETAQRELLEEAGLVATTWTKLGETVNPHLCTVFLAEGLTEDETGKTAEDGIANTVRLTPAELEAMIAAGTFNDSVMLAGLYLYEKYRSGKLHR